MLLVDLACEEVVEMNLLKKTLGVCLMGLGVGMLLVLLLPATGWLFVIGSILLLLGIFWLCK